MGQLLTEGLAGGCSDRRGFSDAEREEAKLQAAATLVEQGELSHAARVLRSTGLAPGDDTTLQQLRDHSLRPPTLQQPLPREACEYAPAAPIQLDRDVLASALQSARRGLSPGLGGTRYEYLKLCLEDETAMLLLTTACERIAQGDLPPAIAEAMRMSQLTALKKTGGRVRGVAAGDTYRRLVGKVLARQV